MSPSHWRALEPSLQHLAPPVREGLRRIVESRTPHQRHTEVSIFAKQFAGELSPLVLKLAVASHAESRRLALELVGRQRTPGAVVQRSARQLLSDRSTPVSARLAATRGLLRAVGRDKRAAYKILRRFAAGLGHKRIDRLDRYARWLDRPRLVAKLRSELVGLQRLRCPRCGKARRRYRMTDHLWRRHKLLLDERRARSAYAVLDTLLDRTSPTDALCALHRRILAAGLGDDEARDHLFLEAEKRHDGVCPRCFGFVPVGSDVKLKSSGSRGERPDLPPRLSQSAAGPGRTLGRIGVVVAGLMIPFAALAPPTLALITVASALAGVTALTVRSLTLARPRAWASPPVSGTWVEPAKFEELRADLEHALAGRVPLVRTEELAGSVSLLSTAEQARLRAILCDKAFAAGLTATELNLLGRAFPPFDQLFTEQSQFVAMLHRLWQMRGDRPWRRCGAATTVFELARYPGLALEALERTDDLLLLHPLPPPGPHDEAAPIALCARGILFRGQWIDAPGAVRVIRLREGGYEIRVDNRRWRFVADPGMIAGRLKRWMEYWFGEFLASAEGEQHLSSPWVELLHANAVACPDCGADVVPAPGRMAITVPRVHRD